MGGGCGRSGTSPSCAPAGAAQAAAITHAAIGSLTASDDNPVPPNGELNRLAYLATPRDLALWGSADRITRSVLNGSLGVVPECALHHSAGERGAILFPYGSRDSRPRHGAPRGGRTMTILDPTTGQTVTIRPKHGWSD